jgi:hypothetical protein
VTRHPISKELFSQFRSLTRYSLLLDPRLGVGMPCSALLEIDVRDAVGRFANSPFVRDLDKRLQSPSGDEICVSKAHLKEVLLQFQRLRQPMVSLADWSPIPPFKQCCEILGGLDEERRARIWNAVRVVLDIEVTR